MTSQPKPFNLRMLTTDQIRKLSDHGLKRYRSKVLLIRYCVHAQQEAGEDWAEANKVPDPVAYIRHLDKVAGDVYREVELRKSREGSSFCWISPLR